MAQRKKGRRVLSEAELHARQRGMVQFQSPERNQEDGARRSHRRRTLGLVDSIEKRERFMFFSGQAHRDSVGNPNETAKVLQSSGYVSDT
jgi:hypothetical protein